MTEPTDPLPETLPPETLAPDSVNADAAPPEAPPPFALISAVGASRMAIQPS